MIENLSTAVDTATGEDGLPLDFQSPESLLVQEEVQQTRIWCGLRPIDFEQHRRAKSPLIRNIMPILAANRLRIALAQNRYPNYPTIQPSNPRP